MTRRNRPVIPRGALSSIFVLIAIAMTAWADTEQANVLAEHGFQSTTDDVARCLSLFAPKEEDRQRIQRLFEALGSEKFFDREEAHSALLKYPLLPADLIQNAMISGDPEVVFRTRRIAVERGGTYSEDMFRAALATIHKHRLGGLTENIADALEGFEKFSLTKPATQALSATAAKADAPKLRAATKSENPVVRGAVVPVLVQLLDKEAIVDLQPLLADSHDRVKLMAALAIADFGDAACLMPFVELLRSQDLYVRLKAVKALRYLTARKFDYQPTAEEKDRDTAIAKWQAWVKSSGAVAKLNHPLDITDEMALLADAGLAGWKVVVNGQVAPSNVWRKSLSVKDGILTCAAGFNGYLRPDRELTNYQLTLDWRWPTAQFNDAGVMLLMTGADGGDGNGLEVQLHQGNAGDFYRIGGFRAGVMRTGVRSRLADSSERPQGAWNRMVAEVKNGEVTIKINDVLQNKATGCPKEPTRVGLRIERYPIEFRNVLLLPLE
jgi:hypothetical protein